MEGTCTGRSWGECRHKVSARKEAYMKRKQILAPHRVSPGNLSVSRTIGDIDAKLPKYGGNPNVVIATPDIISFDLTSSHDFIFLGSTFSRKHLGDGVFNRLTNEVIAQTAWTVFRRANQSIHHLTAKATEEIVHAALARKTFDNVTGILIAFEGVDKFLRSEMGEAALMGTGGLAVAKGSGKRKRIIFANCV